MLLSIGKLLALAVAGGGGLTAYYLSRPSDQKSSQSSYRSTSQEPNCRKPYELKLDGSGVTYYLETKQEAENYLKEEHGNKGKVSLRQSDSCPHWKSLPA
ncbi:hypothetical protein DNK47_02655 [Mycoplasma wenyonii]|uniref:Uncharacterized protein n=1 Tax=Mycoplasma wenyonii TaxID=65123 RepID=A0A328PP33_9MOLU|nr:hypothetical protein [Mycoplasma wenyonii]RAO94876.1 hypothetical protein DNK47_02655 [Mycoplasma wenyonii]